MKKISRKGFFEKIINDSVDFLTETSLLKSLEPKDRPPGAHPDDSVFKQLCTGCDLCMIACPVNVVMIEDIERRYPVIYPEKDPCQRCADTPCITACPTGALLVNNYEVDHGCSNKS